MAPYFDHDGNGIYDPSFGDYPFIRGDQCIFFMANDDRTHTETQGDSLLVEIHCMAYAYDNPQDSILDNTVFLHFDLINRSENIYYDTYFGTFTDFAIGDDWEGEFDFLCEFCKVVYLSRTENISSTQIKNNF